MTKRDWFNLAVCLLAAGVILGQLWLVYSFLSAYNVF